MTITGSSKSRSSELKTVAREVTPKVVEIQRDAMGIPWTAIPAIGLDNLL